MPISLMKIARKGDKDLRIDIGRFSLSETLTKEVDEIDQSKCFEHGIA